MVQSDQTINDYSLLFEALSDCILLVDKDGVFLHANANASKLLLKGITWTETPFYKSLIEADWIGKLNQVTQQQSASIQCDWLRGSVKLTAVPSSDNQLIAVVVKEEQITSKADLTQELEKLKQEFHDFAYIISHDLQAPVRAVNSLVDWFKEDYEDAVDDAGKEQLKLLKDRTARLGKMIEAVLEYSRINRKHTVPGSVNLKVITDKVLKTLQPAKSITYKMPGEIPVVYANEQKMIRLFTALLENAFRFAKEEVQLVMREEKTAFLIQIIDDGQGIPSTKVDTVFKIFQTLSKEQNHIGLGLTIAKKIVEFYNGKIWIDSSDGRGCTVNISIPKSNSVNPLLNQTKSS